MARTFRHPNSEIEEALRYAESKGWQIEKAGRSGHAWGALLCPHNSKTCRCGVYCRNSIWSTPRSPGNHARQIYRWVNGCTFGLEGENDD